jgi:hypothetical protein
VNFQELKDRMADAKCDALYYPGGQCTCLIGDLAPCGDGWDSCCMGHKVPDSIEPGAPYSVVSRGAIAMEL